MKIRSLITAKWLMALVLATSCFSVVSAQQVRGQFRGEGRPGNRAQLEKLRLTEDQQKQMAELRASFQAETMKTKNLIREKEAHLKTLIDTENRDSKDLDRTISELTAYKGDLIRKGIAHRDAVKKILTPEQMRIWDKKAHQMMHHQRMMRGAGMNKMEKG